MMKLGAHKKVVGLLITGAECRRFDFLQMSTFYEGSLVGPSEQKKPKGGSMALEMLFTYYAGRFDHFLPTDKFLLVAHLK